MTKFSVRNAFLPTLFILQCPVRIRIHHKILKSDKRRSVLSFTLSFVQTLNEPNNKMIVITTTIILNTSTFVHFPRIKGKKLLTDSLWVYIIGYFILSLPLYVCMCVSLFAPVLFSICILMANVNGFYMCWIEMDSKQTGKFFFKWFLFFLHLKEWCESYLPVFCLCILSSSSVTTWHMPRVKYQTVDICVDAERERKTHGKNNVCLCVSVWHSWKV